jgi:hypothetical protein
VSLTKEDKVGNDRRWTFRVANNSGKLAFFTRMQLMTEGEEVLPSFWSGNYITLADGESASLTVSCPDAELNGTNPVLQVSGWNVTKQEIILKKN